MGLRFPKSREKSEILYEVTNIVTKVSVTSLSFPSYVSSVPRSCAKLCVSVYGLNNTRRILYYSTRTPLVIQSNPSSYLHIENKQVHSVQRKWRVCEHSFTEASSDVCNKPPNPSVEISLYG